MNATYTGNPTTEAQAGAMLAAKPEIIERDGVPIFVTPNGQMEIVEPLLTKPVRNKGFVSLRDIGSFLSYADAKKEAGSEILLQAEGDIEAKLLINADTFRDFGALYVPVMSTSFKDWMGHDQERMDQEEFALFVERHIDDIHSEDGMPSAGDLLTFCSSIEDNRQVNFKKSVSLQDGRVELVYTEKSSDTQEQRLKLFRQFKLALRPYMDHGGYYPITANLKFRIRDGQITFWYELKELETLREQIRNDIRSELTASNLPVYLADL